MRELQVSLTTANPNLHNVQLILTSSVQKGAQKGKTVMKTLLESC
jgi:hypothetical protein